MTDAPILSHPRYEPKSVLGRGAQGVVVRVVDREAPRLALVAKVFRRGAFDERSLAGEFALLSRARVPGLARAHDLGRCDATGASFLVEDFVEGPEATAWVAEVKEDPSAATARTTAILSDVATTLAGLHDMGFLHGDLKPAHVRVARAPGGARAMVLDLGAAMTREETGSARGAFTRAYASPEVVAGGAPSPLSDLFGLGALAWELTTGAPPPERAESSELRALAPWLSPQVTGVIGALLARHPRDRPESARDVLAELGAATPRAAQPGRVIGREAELAALLGDDATPVRYLAGDGGAGKSLLLSEIVTRALLAGQPARLLRLPHDGGRALAPLVAFLRGDDAALPFLDAGRATLLLALDDVHLGPRELADALDVYRSRPARALRVRVVASLREAPDGAPAIALGPLDAVSLGELGAAVGLDEGARAAAVAASGGNPGWIVATAGCVPLDHDVALQRARGLSQGARDVLGLVAAAGGHIDRSLLERATPRGPHEEETLGHSIAELLAASLLSRVATSERVVLSLVAPGLAADLARAIARPELVASLARAALDDASTPLETLAAAATLAAEERDDLLERAAAVARACGRTTEELDSLLALAASPSRRTPSLLARLERLTRDAGAAATHPQVLDWLGAAAEASPELEVLVLRRRAERAAREGDASQAAALVDLAKEGARGRAVDEALVLATAGVVALHRAAYEEADRALRSASARLAAELVSDREEIARLDHNLGVVALYRGRFDDAARAFERSLEIKRALGDRAGMRACLLNLGLAHGKAGRLDDADEALESAMTLARALRQTSGRAWVLAARADVALKRGDARGALLHVDEGTALGAAVPKSVTADLALLRAEAHALEGDGAKSLAALAALTAEQRALDPLVNVRALVVEARAVLAALPVDARRAARLAVRATRAARRAALAEVESQAIAILRAVRLRRGAPGAYASVVTTPITSATGSTDRVWSWLEACAGGASIDEAATGLARVIAEASGAERAFVVAAERDGRVGEAWGADMDGLALAEAAVRAPREIIAASVEREGAVYQRDVDAAGGRTARHGARLAIAGPRGQGARAVVALEHRFAVGAFDGVTPDTAQRWATLAALALRLGPPAEGSLAAPSSGESGVRSVTTRGASAGEVPAPRASAPTTAFPALVPSRSFPGIIGKSDALLAALARLEVALASDLPVLVVGETGSGKELFSRALHDLGPRRARPFVAVNCGAIPDALFEAELFGHARGSFTGAERARGGLLARAERGTLLLDEIGELPLLRQAALLRALEERRYRPVGSDEESAFDVRVVAATNKDLDAAATAGAFRRDLLYRLNAIEIRVPPLREREGDIPELARAFLGRAKSSAKLSSAALDAMSAYAWPGNVRELEHLVQRLSLLSVKTLDVEHLPRAMRSRVRPRAAEAPPARASGPQGERAEVERALLASGGNISRAAALLDLTRHGLKKRMVRLGMRASTASGRDKRPEEKAG